MGLLHPDNRDYNATGGAVPPGNHFTGGTHQHHHAGVNPATHIPATQTAATGPAPNTAGPHKHDILNRLDPKVDSDLSKTAQAHNESMLGGAGAGAGVGGRHAGHTGHHVNPAVAGAAGAGIGAEAAHHHNTHGKNHTAVPMAGGAGAAGYGASGSYGNNGMMASGAGGPAHKTAGPHSSDMANRLDPTVDSRTGLRK
ncbi:hypothetical protein SCUCBS95973_009923 [Sporothrix curviconia]|uniref:Uncharacterized protein n=1 Tax=Sporothrix curviconia TaxID=1260050 RepID=A0ABP0D0N5_9PEZI